MMRSLLPVLIVSLVSLGITTGCIDPLSPDLEESPAPLVVDGLLTDGPGPHEVQLSRAGAFEQSLSGIDFPVPDAEVIIEDDAGNQVRLNERQRDSGIYVTDEGALIGTVGRTYTLRITLPDGSTYTSTPEQMRPVPRLDTLIVRPTEEPEGSLKVLAGFTEPEESGQFYRWSLNSVAGFGIDVIPNCSGSDRESDICFFRDTRTTGFANVTNDQLINGKSVLRPIRTFESESPSLNVPHAMRVQQQSLTPEAYTFWNAIREQIDNNGTTFSNPPSRIEGNVRNPDDPTDVALGFFQVSAVSLATRCIDPEDYPSYVRDRSLPCSTCTGERLEASTVEPEDRTEVCPTLESGPDPDPGPPSL